MSSSLNPHLLDCSICQNLLYQPITTTCGHSFCKSCLLRVADYDNHCPLCRRVVYLSPDTSVNVVLQEIISSQFAEEYRKRKEELEKENLQTEKFNLPLFLLGDLTLFPSVHLPLHVFEPRYRLMIRRCLEGGRMFGVVPTIGGELQKIGTAALIENYWHLPDGRMLVMTTGHRRFRVLETWTQDNYTVAKIEYFLDRESSPEDGALVKELNEQLRTFILERFGNMRAALEEKFGKMPTEPSDFSFWLSSVMPLGSQKKMELLSSDTVLGRMRILKQLVDQLMQTQACTVF